MGSTRDAAAGYRARCIASLLVGRGGVGGRRPRTRPALSGRRCPRRSQSLARDRRATASLLRQASSSFQLYLTGLALAIVVGAPFGMLLARVRWLRVALEDYIMVLYATPMVALIPVHPVDDGLRLRAQGAGGVPVRGVPGALQHHRGRAQHQGRSWSKSRTRSARANGSLWRDVMIPYTLPFTMTGIRQAIARGLVGMVAAEILPEPLGARPDDHDGLAEFRHGGHAGGDPDHRAARAWG